MVQVLEAGTPKGPTFAQRMNAGLGKGLEVGERLMAKHQQRQVMKELGLPENIPLDLAKTLLSENAKAQSKEKMLAQKLSGLQGIFGGQGRSQIGGLGGDISPDMQPSEPNPLEGKAFQDLDVSSLTDEDIAIASAIDPSIGRALSHAKDVALREKREERALGFQREKFEHQKKADASKIAEHQRSERRKETAPLRQEIAKKAMAAEEGIKNKSRLLELVESGEINDPTFASLAEALPLDLGVRLLSPETVEYKAGLIDEYKDLRNIFIGTTRIKEIELLEKKVADIYLTDEQKKAVLKSRINALKADLIRAEEAANIENEDFGVIEFQRELNRRVLPRMEELANQIVEEQKAIINLAESKKNAPLNLNDPEDRQIAMQILQEAGGDKLRARELAKKKGYKF